MAVEVGKPGECLQGWCAWAGALGLILLFPRTVWKAPGVPDFPWNMILPSLLLLGALTLSAPLLILLLGSRVAASRILDVWSAPPDFLWGGLFLAIWPAAWGPPGLLAWGTAFLLWALPLELRWLAQALPGERPFPEAWGRRVSRRARFQALLHLIPAWVAVRLPLWIVATLVLERILGVRGLGSDWLERIHLGDRPGLALWILSLAFLWRMGR